MKIFKWIGKGNYTNSKLDLIKNVGYEIGKDISEEEAKRIFNDFPDMSKIINQESEEKNEDKVKESDKKVKIVLD